MFGYKYRNNAYKGIKISYVSLKINTSLPLNIKKKLFFENNETCSFNRWFQMD